MPLSYRCHGNEILHTHIFTTLSSNVMADQWTSLSEIPLYCSEVVQKSPLSGFILFFFSSPLLSATWRIHSSGWCRSFTAARDRQRGPPSLSLDNIWSACPSKTSPCPSSSSGSPNLTYVSELGCRRHTWLLLNRWTASWNCVHTTSAKA